MIATSARIFPEWFGTGLTVACYLFYFWRTFKKNPGNRLIECGSITLMAFFVLMALTMFGDIPGWLFGAWMFLKVLLCFTTLFFLAQRMMRAVRGRKILP